MNTLRCFAALPFFILGLPATPGFAAVATQAFSSMTCSRPLFGWTLDAILMLVGIPFFPFLLIGLWIWPEDDDFWWGWMDRVEARLRKGRSTQI